MYHLSFRTYLKVLLVASVAATKPGFPPSLTPGCLAEDGGNVNVFCPGDQGYGCYKIPTLLMTRNGTILAMIEARKFSCDDEGYIDLRVKRSTDSGKSWGPSQLVHGNSTDSQWTTVGDANMVQDTMTGTIWLIHARNNSQLYLSHSDDDGLTWSIPVDFTSSLKFGYPNQQWVGTGHAGGIQISQGPHKGRLIIPAYSNTSYTIYSDDHGSSWQIGGVLTGSKAWGAECQIAETGQYNAEGTPILLISMRNNPDLPSGITGTGYRLQALSKDGGLSWEDIWESHQLPEPIRGCEGSLVYHPGTQKLYFSHPDPVLDLFRTRLRIWSSNNMGNTWEEHATVWNEAAGYSAMIIMKQGLNTDGQDAEDLGILYDRNNHTMVVFEAQSVSFTTVAS